MLAKELHPVRDAACRLASAGLAPGCLLVFGVDNSGGSMCLNAGRAYSLSARDIMRDLADLQIKHRFTVFGFWVPRELNGVADALSRQILLRAALEAGL